MGEKRVICSISVELNDDHMQLLKCAEENGGHLTYSLVLSKLPSYNDKSRFKRAIDRLIEEGLVWEDAQAQEMAYWFPSLMASLDSADDLMIIKKSQ
jgi:hypothetical protein